MPVSQHAVIRYVHGNRLERLAETLAGDLAAAPPGDALAAEVIVVPHPGMGRWLQRELARHWGVAMRLELPLPGGFTWRVATRLAGLERASGAYESGPLAFRIYSRLDAWSAANWRNAPRDLPRPRDAIAAWSLAERLAGLFDQYLVYRPAWIDAWDTGGTAPGMPAHGAWQADFWRSLRARDGAPHRAEILRTAMRALAGPVPATVVLPNRISVSA